MVSVDLLSPGGGGNAVPGQLAQTGASIADPLDVGDNTWLRLSADQEMETREESRSVHSTESHSHERRTPTVTAAARVT